MTISQINGIREVIEKLEQIRDHYDLWGSEIKALNFAIDELERSLEDLENEEE